MKIIIQYKNKYLHNPKFYLYNKHIKIGTLFINILT
jgi:hypothetical protein